jgi:hypothetical protein
MQGWSKMPAEVPPMMMAPPPVVDAGAPAAAPGDAGVRPATDAGAPTRKPTKKTP